MTIRKIEKTDKPELLKMMVEFYNSPALLHHTPERVLSRVIDDCTSSPYLTGYVITCDGKICAYTMLSLGYSTEYGGVSVFMEDLYVRPEYRGRGCGKALIDRVKTEYGGKAARLRLEVAKDNAAAIALYKRCGFCDIDYKQMSIEFGD